MQLTHNSRVLGRAGAVVLLCVVAASCSSNTAPDSAAPTTTSTTAAAAPSASSAEDAAEITAITKTYVTGLNNGDAPMLKHALCQGTLAMYDDLSVNARPSPSPQQLISVTGIQATGDTAIANIEFTLVSDPSAASKTVPLGYRNEGGWKVCTV